MGIVLGQTFTVSFAHVLRVALATARALHIGAGSEDATANDARPLFVLALLVPAGSAASAVGFLGT